MYRVRALPTALAALILHGLILGPAMAIVRIEIDPTVVQVDVEPQDVEHARSVGEDGSFVVGGHLGAQSGCPGVQAFVQKILAGGTVAWALSASADKDCDGDGQPDGGGDAMFAGMTTLDPDYILSSTTHDTVNLRDGTSYVTGQLLVAWDDGGEPTAVWGAFVLHLSAQGELLADLYTGVQPTGSPAVWASCDALCSALGNTSLAQSGGRALAVIEDPADGAASGIVLAGWLRPAADQATNGQNVFVAALAPDLASAKWFRHIEFPGADQPLDVAVGGNGDVYATGYYGPEHEVFVVCFDGQTGVPSHFFLGGGPLDDWGETVEVTAGGEVVVEGKFTDVATFVGQTLEGDGLTAFRARLTAALEPILIEVIGGPNGGGTAVPTGQASLAMPLKSGVWLPPQLPLPPSEPGGTHSNMPTAIEVLVGVAGSGTSPTLVSTSDDDQYLTLYGEQRPDHKKVEVVFEVPIDPGAPRLKSVKLELESSYCTDLTVSLGGGSADPDVFYEIGDAQICPLDKPMITVEIPLHIAEQELGFTASFQPSTPLLVLLSMLVHGDFVCPPGLFCTSGEDESIDSMMTESEPY